MTLVIYFILAFVVVGALILSGAIWFLQTTFDPLDHLKHLPRSEDDD